MRYVLSFMLLAAIHAVAPLCGQMVLSAQDVKAPIEVVFTNDQTIEDLDRIQMDMAKAGVKLEYLDRQFDENAKLRSISFTVYAGKGREGSASADDLSGDDRFGFRIEGEKAEVPFRVGHIDRVRSSGTR